jgi:hypothetical protein
MRQRTMARSDDFPRRSGTRDLRELQSRLSKRRGRQESLLRTIARGIARLRAVLWPVQPLRLEEAYIAPAGDGSLLAVRYRTNHPLPPEAHNKAVCLLHQATGRRLSVQRVPFFGNLTFQSRSEASSREGYFVVDNSSACVGPGDAVTVVVGGLRKEGVLIRG